jgi:hypothetical protein
VFDDAALYVGVRLDDSAAGAIQAPLGRRDDENNSDWCFVEIDSRRDRRTAFSLGVNPAGVQVDGVFVDDINYDASWNGVWEARTQVDASGWAAEYRIPFALLASQAPAAGEPMRWGPCRRGCRCHARRAISRARHGELGSRSALPRLWPHLGQERRVDVP